MQTHHMGHVDSVEIDDDEGRFQLIVTTNDGDRYRFDIHAVALEFAASKGLGALAEWAADARAIQREVQQHRGLTYDCVNNDHGSCDRDWCECDCHALALDDPKHPTYGERMRVAADNGRPDFRFLEGPR